MIHSIILSIGSSNLSQVPTTNTSNKSVRSSDESLLHLVKHNHGVQKVREAGDTSLISEESLGYTLEWAYTW